MRLTKEEIKFIRLAAIINEGVFDYEIRPYQFKDTYGLSYKEATEMCNKLADKCNVELRKIELKK